MTDKERIPDEERSLEVLSDPLFPKVILPLRRTLLLRLGKGKPALLPPHARPLGSAWVA